MLVGITAARRAGDDGLTRRVGAGQRRRGIPLLFVRLPISLSVRSHAMTPVRFSECEGLRRAELTQSTVASRPFHVDPAALPELPWPKAAEIGPDTGDTSSRTRERPVTYRYQRSRTARLIWMRLEPSAGQIRRPRGGGATGMVVRPHFQATPSQIRIFL